MYHINSIFKCVFSWSSFSHKCNAYLLFSPFLDHVDLWILKMDSKFLIIPFSYKKYYVFMYWQRRALTAFIYDFFEILALIVNRVFYSTFHIRIIYSPSLLYDYFTFCSFPYNCTSLHSIIGKTGI